MPLRIHSQAGIVALLPATLITVIRKLQTDFPGYWWSISQHPGQITFSVGPSRHCPSAEDVVFSKTKRGDEGFIMTHFHPSHDREDVLEGFINTIGSMVRTFRAQALVGVHDLDAIEIEPSYRSQDDADLLQLQKDYGFLLDHISEIENQDFILQEIYIGLCELTVDCSLRGKDPDDNEFDVSEDWDGDSRLHHSVAIATNALLDMVKEYSPPEKQE